MSKAIAVVSAGAAAALTQAATSIIAKASNNSVAASIASVVGSGASVVVGSETPQGVHTAVTKAVASVTGTGPYAGVSSVYVRSIIPRGAPDSFQVKDLLDVYADAGIPSTDAVAAAKASVAKSAKVAVEQAKAIKATRITLVMKQATMYTQLNSAFQEAATQVIEGAGLTVDILGTSQAANQLLMFPENLPVVLAADVSNSEETELAFAGALGGVCRTYYGDNGVVASAGHSQKSITLAVAQQLRALGMSKEASSLEEVAAKGNAI